MRDVRDMIEVAATCHRDSHEAAACKNYVGLEFADQPVALTDDFYDPNRIPGIQCDRPDVS